MQTCWLIILLALSFGCVKDEGKISQADTAGGTTGSSSGGSTTGNPSTGTDPLYFQAWHLKNTGQNSFSASTGIAGEDIAVENVHGSMNIRGRNIRVAVSDTGTDIAHADLASNTLSGEHRNYSLSLPNEWVSASPTPPSDEAHGTGVAGLIAALGWNNIGSRGVAPEAKFAAFRFVYGASSETDESRLAKEIDQYYGEFDIFNYSYGMAGYVFYPEDDDVKSALELGVTELRNGKGANYIQSSGNSFEEDYYICDPDDPLELGADCLIEASGNSNSHEALSTPYKIVVGAVNASGERSSYSTPGANLWISAPGGEFGISEPAMITTDISGCSAGMSYRSFVNAAYFDFGYNDYNLLCDYTNRFNGTSSAAPVISGIVALMLEANPDLTWRDVKHILAATAEKVDYDPLLNALSHPRMFNLAGGYTYDFKWVENAAGFLFSNWYGFGRANAEEAVAMALSYNLSTLGTFEQTKNNIGTWYYDSGPLTGYNIIDESPMPTEHKIWVGHDYVIESVQIQFTTDHPWPGDLAVHLVSPEGTESRLMTINNKIYGEDLAANFTMLSNAFYGEESNGYWTIKFYDGDSFFGTGQITNWKILISGHKKYTDLSLPLPPTFMSMDPTPVSSTVSPVFAFSDSATSGVLWYEAAVGTTPSNESAKAWANIGLTNYGQQITGLNLIDGQTYYLKLRARTAAGYSSVQVLSWEADTL